MSTPYQDIQPSKPIEIKAIERQDHGQWLLQPLATDSYLEILQEYGVTPLPPYIHRDYSSQTEQVDRKRYQTVYAHEHGSVAAPTAGLHFTDELLARISEMGIKTAHVTLHVGMGTFKPVTAETLEEHDIHAEQYSLDEANAAIINQTLESGSKVIAVGTTSVRTIETLASNDRVKAGNGWTRLFIMPGYEFQVTKAIITNFHLPKSTLLALISAFAGHEQIMNAYRYAVDQKYRFYSYGDAMLII